MTTMATCNYVIAMIAALIGCLIAYFSYGYGIEMTVFGPGAGFWPFILGCALIFCAVMLVIDTVRKKELFAREAVLLITTDNTTVYKMMALTVGYVLLLPIAGFYATTLAFLCLAMYLLGARSWKHIGTVALVFCGVVYVLFDELLSISFPLPFFMD